MPPLRILHVTPYSADAWAYGGIPRLAATLTRDLARRGHAVTVATTDAHDATSRMRAPIAADGQPGGAWPSTRTRDGVVLRVFPNVSNHLAYHWQLFLPRGFRSFMRRHARDFDIAHLHACRNLPTEIAARHLGRAGVPFVLAPNGTAGRIERRLLAKRTYDVLAGQRALRRAARVVAVSRAEQQQLRALDVPEEAIALVPNPIDLEEFAAPIQRGRLRIRCSLGAGGPIVLFLGKLTPRKRIDLLVDAFARLDRANATLVIAGNDMGSGSDIKAAVRARGLDDRVRFTGLLRGHERLEALADADVVVYPSEHEVFGLVPLEALLAGTSVIVADDSGCGEVIRTTGGGQVIPAGDVVALTDAINLVIQSPDLWRTHAARAAARVRQLYGNETICDQIADQYRAILGDGSRLWKTPGTPQT